MSEIVAIKQSTIDRTIANLDDIKQAIEDKDVEVGNAPVNTYADKIRAIASGGSGGDTTQKEVSLYDYDGTVLYSYSLSEIQELTSLPDPPTHAGLVFQGWNWSLSNIKAFGRAVNVGAMYVTASGKSEFDLTLTAVTGLAVTMRIYNSTAGGVITVDWGDGTIDDASTTTTGAKTFMHTYAEIGHYTATVDSTGEYYPYGTSSSPYNMFNQGSLYICTSIKLGIRCKNIGAYAFRLCYKLTSITIPDSVTSIGTYAFNSCALLTSITIPDGVTSIGTYACNTCPFLVNIIIPDSITRIDNYVFGGCYSITSITIPDSVTSIGAYAFYNCCNIIKYTMLASTPPTLSNINAFGGINGICIIEVPQGSLTAYQTATNWSTYADYMMEAS